MPVPTARQKTGARNSSRPLPSRGGRAKRRTRPVAGRDAKVRGAAGRGRKIDGAGQRHPWLGSCGRPRRQNGRACGNCGRADARRERAREPAAGVEKRRVADDVMDAARTSSRVTEKGCPRDGRSALETGKKVGALRNSGRADGRSQHCGLAPAVGGDAVPIRRWRTCACVPRGRCLRQEFPRPRACGTPRRS